MKPWTNQQLQILHNNAGKIKTDELAKMIGRSTASVQQRACREGISLKASFERKKRKIIVASGCSYEKALPYEQWDKAQALLCMMGKLKRSIPNNINPVLDMEQLREAFAIREVIVNC